MEASALQHSARLPALGGRSPLLRLQSDEKLVALTRRGHHGAFEALVQRYTPRLLAFCRHMLGSQEDAEDVLQEVFAASFNAMCADERPINARPWLYRIARNRCLNHLRRPQPAGQDSMDVFERDGGVTTADTVHKREEFRHIVSDVQELPETQRTALLLREIDALSYEQIAETMDTTVPSVKSLLVRARVSLAEAAEARLLTCEEVRDELGQVEEGLQRTTAPVRRHLRSCERCRVFRGELRRSTRALAAVFPIGPLVLLKKLSLAKLGVGGAGGAAAGSGSLAGAGGIAGGAGAAAGGAAAGGAAGGAISAGIGAIASKAAAGMAAAVIVTAGAVEVRHATSGEAPVKPAPVAVAPPTAAPTPAPASGHERVEPKAKAKEKQEVAQVAITPKPEPVAPVAPPAEPEPEVTPPVQEEGSTVSLPPRERPTPSAQPAQPIPPQPSEQQPPPQDPAEQPPAQPQPPTAPITEALP